MSAWALAFYEWRGGERGSYGCAASGGRQTGRVTDLSFYGAWAVLVFYGVQLNPSEAQAKSFPGKGDAINGRRVVADAHLSAGIYKPFVILVENNGDPKAIAVRVARVPGRVRSWPRSLIAAARTTPSRAICASERAKPRARRS